MALNLFDHERRVSSVNAVGTKLVGYAAVFNSLSEDLGGFFEKILPGAFSDVLNQDVRALLNHDPNFLLGRTKNNTLKLTQDLKGLAVEIILPDTSLARDLIVSVKRKDISQMSIGFTIAPDGDTWEKMNGSEVRTIRKIGRLFDVSVVSYPAFAETSIDARSRANSLKYGKKPQEDSAFERRLKLALFKAQRKISDWEEERLTKFEEREMDNEAREKAEAFLEQLEKYTQ